MGTLVNVKSTEWGKCLLPYAVIGMPVLIAYQDGMPGDAYAFYSRLMRARQQEISSYSTRSLVLLRQEVMPVSAYD